MISGKGCLQRQPFFWITALFGIQRNKKMTYLKLALTMSRKQDRIYFFFSLRKESTAVSAWNNISLVRLICVSLSNQLRFV